MPVALGVIAVWLAIGAVAVVILRRKGHDAFSWMLLFTVLGPVAVPLAISVHRHPPGESGGHPHGGRFDVLVDHDGSPAADRALASALDLFGEQMTSLTLAAVVDLEAATTVRGHLTESEEQARLEGVASGLIVACGPVETVVLHGCPADALAHFAAEHGYELVVVGADERPAWRRVVAGSASHGLASATPVPIFVGPAAR